MNDFHYFYSAKNKLIMRYKFLIICFSFFFVNSLFANIASDSTRTKSTKQLVAQIKKERIKVVKKLKLIKSEAKGEKLYLDFEQTNLSLMNKIEEKERYLIYNENYNIDLKKLPVSLKVQLNYST